MANKQNMVSVGAWERIRKETGAPNVHTVDWHGESLEIKPLIPFAAVCTLVDSVVADCFGETMEEYRPAAKEFSMARYFIHFYTNLRLPADIEKQYDLIFGTDILSVVEDHIDYVQKEAIRAAIDEKIETLLDMNTAYLNRQLGKIAEAIDDADRMFSGVNPGDLENLVKSVSNDGLNAGKLMEAYLRNNGAKVSLHGASEEKGAVNAVDLA